MTGLVEEPGSAPGATAPSNISRLNPQDGLFLQSKHLNAIQDYARDVARAVGMGAGTGVVYGFTVTLEGTTLRVGPGLAIDPQGRPLRSDADAVIELKDPPALDSGGNGFLVVEVGPAEWASGHEKVYGEVCGDCCSGSGSSIQPLIGEGITVELVPRSIEGLGTANPAHRRNRLASLFFAQERMSGTWVRPEPGLQSPPVTSWDWSAGTAGATAARVPIAALLAVNGAWVLDVWIARRDIDGPPAKSLWNQRLSLRPWNIFMAQVLQFQAQLSSHAQELEQLEIDAEAFESLEQLKELYLKIKLTRAQEKAVGQELRETVETANKTPGTRIKSGKSLRVLGFEDLPPAGYLPIPTSASTDEAVRLLLGRQVDLRFRSCTADYVARAVDESQHRDRISLLDAKRHTQVDILIPTPAADGLSLGWVAFVHRNCCEVKEEVPDTEEVDVYITSYNDNPESFMEQLQQNPKMAGELVAQLRYPLSRWDYPADTLKVTEAFMNYFTEDFKKKGYGVYLVGLSTKERLPLITLRASLLGASLDSGLLAPVYSLEDAKNLRESIIIGLSPGRLR